MNTKLNEVTWCPNVELTYGKRQRLFDAIEGFNMVLSRDGPDGIWIADDQPNLWASDQQSVVRCAYDDNRNDGTKS